MAGTHKVDIVVEAQNNAKKVLDSIQKSIDNLTQSVARSQAIMAQNIGNIANSVDAVRESFNKISTSAQRVSRDTKKIHYDWRSLVWTIVRAEIILRGIMRIVNGIKNYFASMLDTLDEYQISLLQLSAIQTTLLQGTVKSKDELERLFNRMYSINQSVYQTLLKMSAQTPLTTEQLLRLYRAWLAYGQVVDLSNEKMRKGLLAVANAIYMMSGGFQVNRQLVQETRGLITQTSLAYSDLARFIIRSGIASKEQLQTWRDQNVLLEKMSEKLSGFVIASDRSLETLQGLGTTLESVWKQKVIENFSRAYDSLRAFLKVVLQSQNILGALSSVIHASATAFRIFAIAVLQAGKGIHYVTLLVKNLLQTLWNLVKLPAILPLYPILPPKWRSWWEKEFKESITNLKKGWQTLWNLPEEYSNALEAIRHPEKFVTPTNVLDEQAKKFKDFYTLLQSFATSGSRIADEIDQNLTKIGDAFKENFGIKSLDAYVKAKDYINSLQKGISSFIDAIAKKGKEAKLPQWDLFAKGLKQVAEGKLKIKTFVDSLKELAKTGKVSKDVLELMGQTTLAVSQKIDYLHNRQKKLTDIEKNITNVVLKETKDKLNSLKGSFKSLGAEVERFGIPATTLEAKLKKVDIQFYSLQNRIIKSITNFKDLRDSIEKASKSTKVPEELRIKLKNLLPVLEKYIDKLKEWLGILPKKSNELKKYLKLIEKQRHELLKLREAQVKIEKQYKTAHISAKQYYQSILKNLQKQKQAYNERLKILKKDSQEYISTEEKILQIERRIIDVQLELDKRSNKWREGLRRTLQQYRDSLETTVSGFSMASSTMLSALQGLEGAFSSVFGDIMLGKLRSFKDYFMIFARAVVSEISKLIAKLLILKTLVPVLERVFGISRQTSTRAVLGQSLLNVVGISPTGGGGGLPGVPPTGITGGLLERMTTAPSMLEANWAFRTLSKFPGVQVIRSPKGATLAVRGTPLSKVISNAGWASLGYQVLSRFTGLPHGRASSIGSTIGATIGASVGGPVGAGIGAFIGGTLGGLFGGGGKHHPGNYAWKFKWGGIHIDPQTGKVILDKPIAIRTYRAGKPDNTVLTHFGWGFQGSYLFQLKNTISNLPDKIKVMLITPLEEINKNFKEVEFKTHLEALRQQQPALEMYFKKYYIPALQESYGKLLSSVNTKNLPQFQTGGLVKGSSKGYVFTGLLHGAEHIIPDKKIDTLKQEISELKELFWMLIDTSTNQTKYNKRSYELLRKWDVNGMPA